MKCSASIRFHLIVIDVDERKSGTKTIERNNNRQRFERSKHKRIAQKYAIAYGVCSFCVQRLGWLLFPQFLCIRIYHDHDYCYYHGTYRAWKVLAICVQSSIAATPHLNVKRCDKISYPTFMLSLPPSSSQIVMVSVVILIAIVLLSHGKCQFDIGRLAIRCWPIACTRFILYGILVVPKI